MRRKVGMRNKKIMLMVTWIMLCLTACGKQEVVYHTEDYSDHSESSTTQSTVEGIENENPLIEQLGITDSYQWKETIATGGNPVAVSAEVFLQCSADLVAINAKEYYYSEEEKQNVLYYFLEPDSVEVDLDTYPSKERLRSKLTEYEAVLKEKDAEELLHVTETEKNMITNEIAYLTDCINEAPNRNAISEKVTDYHGNYYKGEKNGLEYSLVFDTDETRNQSGWKLRTKNYSDVLSSHSDVIAWQYTYVTEQKNQCNITGEQAKEIADKACKDLGFSDLQAHIEKEDVVWHMENGSKEVNGYYFEYVLDMNGDTLFEFYSGIYGECVDNQAYENQKVMVIVNDAGIVRMECTGMMQYEKTEHVKLLSYEQIKDCFRNILKEQKDITGEWHVLELSYIRLTNIDDRDMYSYVPVWILLNYEEPAIVINAIDGTQIDTEASYEIIYDTPEDWIDGYYNVMLVDQGVLLESDTSAYFD